MIPPETSSPFEGKTVFGTGCDNCDILQAENKRLNELVFAYESVNAPVNPLLAKIEQQRWIPVSERPKENGRYLVCIEDYCKEVNPSMSWREAHWVDDRWLEINMSVMPWKVTHWKPIILPEDAKAEEFPKDQ